MVPVSVASDPPLRDTVTGPTRAVDIVVRWGEDCVLRALELSPPRSFFVGDDEGCDLALPVEIAGGSRVPVLLARWDGDVRVVVPKGARVVFDGEGKAVTAARAVARGQAEASRMFRDAAEIPLGSGRTIAVRLGPITIEITGSKGALRTPRAPVIERRFGLSQLASIVVHAIVLFAVAALAPSYDAHEDGISQDDMFFIQKMLDHAADRELEWSRREGEESVIEGLERRARRRQRRNRSERALDEAWMKSLSAASERWQAEEVARAKAFEPTSGNAGDTSVIGLFYDRPPPPSPTTLPAGEGRLHSGPSRGPALRMGTTTVMGRLPPEVIQRIVRQNFGRFRLCYENGLRNNPNLQGRVSVKFLIGRDGAVSNVSNAGSDMPDGGVVSCIMRGFYGLSFPQPEGGIVSVVYPVMFSPGG